jgi:hypothetical protein
VGSVLIEVLRCQLLRCFLFIIDKLCGIQHSNTLLLLLSIEQRAKLCSQGIHMTICSPHSTFSGHDGLRYGFNFTMASDMALISVARRTISHEPSTWARKKDVVCPLPAGTCMNLLHEPEKRKHCVPPPRARRGCSRTLYTGEKKRKRCMSSPPWARRGHARTLIVHGREKKENNVCVPPPLPGHGGSVMVYSRFRAGLEELEERER